MNSYQTAAETAEALETQAQELADRARDLKGQPFTREDAETVLKNLRTSTSDLEHTVGKIEAAVGNSAASLHTSHNSR
ncbi:MAG: hypothetical protein VXW32_04190 [Myxococcota bacterium]|nr:hypothetical protein [Myxococcota bacterium]